MPKKAKSEEITEVMTSATEETAGKKKMRANAAAEERTKPAPKPRTPRRPVPQDIRLSARQYVRIKKQRWERCAGFLHAMKSEQPTTKTRPEWDVLWDAFWAKTVK